MLADVLEGLRGRLVDELGRHTAIFEGPSLGPGDGRARLDNDVRQVIGALRRGGCDELEDGFPPVADPEREMAEHELVSRSIREQIAFKQLRVHASEQAIVDRWRYHADRDCLREQNRRLAALLDGVRESAVLLAPDGRILYCNRHAAQVLREMAGIPRGGIVGKTPAELGVPRELFVGRPIGDLVDMARSHESFEVSAWGRTKETQLDALYRPDGQVGAVALLLRDVHGHKQAQQRIDLLSKLSALVGVLDYEEVAEDLARVPIPELADWCAFNVVEQRRIRRTLVASRNPSLAAINDAIMREASGWDRHPLWEQMHTGGFQLLADVSDDLLRRLAGNDEQYRLMSQLGIQSLMLVPLVSRAQIIGIITLAYTSESGRRYGTDDPPLAQELALHSARALENARLMKDLKTSEARFRVALAGARTVVFEQDAALRYTWCYNPLTEGGLRGKTPEESLPAEQAADLAKSKRRVLERGESVREELDLTLENDERRYYREAIEPVRDHTGRIVGIIGAATDITDQQRMQEQLAHDLNFRERMMGILSHDLRSPLGAIAMSADLLLARPGVEPNDRDHLLRIKRSTGRMAEMIETLLDYTRIRFMGTLPVSPASADLGEIARAVTDEMRLARPERAIELRVRGEARGEWDPARMAQAISNLLANAVTYGAPDTTVSVDVEATSGDAIVTVTNQGEPIAPCVLAVIFEPFRRGVEKDRSPHGLGLGLHIVQQIVLAHGGEIDVESAADVGTRFRIRLPRAPRGTPDATSPG
jgi:signal transduction histidine kinase